MISSMNKRLLLMALILTCLTVSAQDVRYYKLSSTRIGGTTKKNVSGGQFVTFVGDLCFESTSKGVGVGHGTLKRNKNYSNAQYSTYQGSSYWGKEAEFIFNADKSVLNVVLDNGDIYVYKCATPPKGVTTCSLIRQKTPQRNDGNYNPTPNPIPPYPPQPISPQHNPDPYNPKPDPPTPQPKQRIQCTCCEGKGEVIKDDAFTLGLGDKKYCDKCRQTVFASHYHAPCKCCNGKGYKEY